MHGNAAEWSVREKISFTTPRLKTIIIHSFLGSSSLTGDERVLFEVAWQHQAKEDGKAQNKEVPGGVEVDKLQVGQSNGRDHSKERAEQGSQDGVGQGRKQGAEFTHEAQQQHHGGAVLNHTSAANL